MSPRVIQSLRTIMLSASTTQSATPEKISEASQGDKPGELKAMHVPLRLLTSPRHRLYCIHKINVRGVP